MLLAPPPSSAAVLTQPSGPPPSPAPHGLAFRPDIEGLRGVAVLLVVAYHAGVPGFGGGFVGVDVFFVLSGYLITALLREEMARTGRVDLVQFYARRARRLLPAAVLVLAATVLVGMFLYPPLEAYRFARSAVAAALYSSNMLFVFALDYFTPSVKTNPLLHTWSLAAEEQFYLLWPLLVMVAGRRSRAGLAWVLGVLSLVSFALCVWATTRFPTVAFYTMPLRAWEFGVGALACLLPAAALAPRRAGVLALAGAAGVLTAGLQFSARTQFPGFAALLPVLGTAALLVAGAAAPRGLVARALGTRLPQLLGRWSYSWYLWHWPILVMAAVLVPGIPLWGRVACALLALLAAWGTYVWVEQPIRHNRALAARPWASLRLGAALTGVALAIGLGWYAVEARQMATPEQARLVAAAADRSRIYGEDCIVGRHRNPRLIECTFGDTTSAVTVVLFGDSHAAHWFPAVEALARERGWKLVTMLKVQCPGPRVLVFSPRLSAYVPQCNVWRESALRRIAELKPAAVVHASWHGYVQHTEGRTGAAQLTVEEWGAGARSTLRAITANGTPVLLVRDPPSMPRSVPACLSGGGSCEMDRARVLHEPAFQAEAAAARGLPVGILDATDRFCDAETCQAERDGKVLYFDANHITASTAASMAPDFGRELDRLMAARAP
jgi:peptidoglycan/LPS O-acetylase OafA/YrhL